jgi:(2Fe-2S) ferredoxin
MHVALIKHFLLLNSINRNISPVLPIKASSKREPQMKKISSNLKTHVFVCTNDKAGAECCERAGGAKVRKELKNWVSEHPEWHKRIRINQSGCLDHCDQGVAVVIYPQNETYVNVASDDLENLKKKITELMTS